MQVTLICLDSLPRVCHSKGMTTTDYRPPAFPAPTLTDSVGIPLTLEQIGHIPLDNEDSDWQVPLDILLRD